MVFRWKKANKQLLVSVSPELPTASSFPTSFKFKLLRQLQFDVQCRIWKYSVPNPRTIEPFSPNPKAYTFWINQVHSNHHNGWLLYSAPLLFASNRSACSSWTAQVELCATTPEGTISALDHWHSLCLPKLSVLSGVSLEASLALDSRDGSNHSQVPTNSVQECSSTPAAHPSTMRCYPRQFSRQLSLFTVVLSKQTQRII